MKTKLLLALVLIGATVLHAQKSKSALFIGNSYTYSNNMPQLVADIAASLGDSLIYDSSAPGGATLNSHTTNSTTQSKIAQGGWDFVFLQEQSQLPAFPPNQFNSQSLPYAITLCNQIRAADSCAKPVFFMTWGRKNGDQQNCANYPPLCTYSGMQNKLRERYLLMADTNNAAVAPVGAVWREMRAANQNVELYTADESHPSSEGSYLSACTFYASIFNQSPVGASAPATIDPTIAAQMQQLAATIVFDSLQTWMIDTLKPNLQVAMSVNMSAQNECVVTFDASTSTNVDSVFWDFGDGTTGSGLQVNHTYTTWGILVTATGYRNCDVVMDTLFNVSDPCWIGIDENALQEIAVFPNPALNTIRVQQFGTQLLNGNFVVYNLSGQKLLAGQLAGQINIEKLAAGNYILKVEKGGKVAHIQFVKSHF